MIYACGTVKRGRRDLPPSITNDKDLRRGKSDYRVSLDGIVYVKWKDTKAVNFLCNHMNSTEQSHTTRKQKDGTLQEIACPKLVVSYRFDMLKSLYEIDRKSKKWWHRIFWYLLDAAVVNA
ncbi:piggyBac transposable element-derived protein 5-like [Onthophagus taurus]|uniref:piggyBac transposable element-derived protein 5-like n=1 Tax=Onthophagus taurus TaxID=166361 RepID=UPI0039BDE86A